VRSVDLIDLGCFRLAGRSFALPPAPLSIRIAELMSR